MEEQPPPQPVSQQNIDQTVVVQQAGVSSNVLGVIGFIMALIGLLLGWCCAPIGALSLLGAVLSFIGMFREPRGLAIAGFILGLLGVASALIIVIFFGAVGFVSMLGLAGLAGMAPQIEATAEASLIKSAISRHQTAHDVLPDSLEELDSLSLETLQDFWDNPYRYTVDHDAGTYTITSDGKDGVEGTEDDMTLYPDESPAR